MPLFHLQVYTFVTFRSRINRLPWNGSRKWTKYRYMRAFNKPLEWRKSSTICGWHVLVSVRQCCPSWVRATPTIRQFCRAIKDTRLFPVNVKIYKFKISKKHKKKQQFNVFSCIDTFAYFPILFKFYIEFGTFCWSNQSFAQEKRVCSLLILRINLTTFLCHQ